MQSKLTFQQHKTQFLKRLKILFNKGIMKMPTKANAPSALIKVEERYNVQVSDTSFLSINSTMMPNEKMSVTKIKLPAI